MANQCIYAPNNPYPRNAFSCGQGKQAVSLFHSNFTNRIDKTSYLLNYGQIPLTKSKYLDYATKEQHPYGENAIVAVITIPSSWINASKFFFLFSTDIPA